MRPRIIWTIFRKEITDTLRDWLTLLVVIVLPLLLYPLLVIGMGKLAEMQAEQQEARVSKIAVWGEAAEVSAWLKPTNSLSLEPWTGAPDSIRRELAAGKVQPLPGSQSPAGESEAGNPVQDAARSLISSRKVDAVLVIWPGFSQALGQGGLGRVSIYFDSVRPSSAGARERLGAALAGFRRAQLQQRERDHGLAAGFTRAVEILPRNVAPPARIQGEVIGSILPLLLILLTAAGGGYAAIDLTAGEKDRGTMQTLLCAPLHSTEMVLGKFCAVWAISLLAALANTTSLAATAARMVSAFGLRSLPLSTYAFTFVMLLPVTFTVAALFLAVAVLARDAKDAGNFFGPALVVLLAPLGASATPGMELNAWTALVPLANISLLIKAFFIAEAKPELIFLAMTSSVLYAGLTLLLAARVFGREQVLLGGKDAVRSLFRIERPQGALPTPAFAFTAFGLIFVAAFYGSLWLEKTGIITVMLATQYGLFLLPVVALAALMRFSPRQTFSLRWPHWRALAAAVLMGLSASVAIGGLVVRLQPPPDSLARALEKLLLLDGKPMPLWTIWLVVGVTPALCEEALFRGLILSGLRRLGQWPAIGLSALLFALAHASIYRLLPTLCLGLLLGYLVWRTGSIVCGMMVHALNNGLLATLAHSDSLAAHLGLTKETVFLPWPLTLLGLAVLALGFLTLHSAPLARERIV